MLVLATFVMAPGWAQADSGFYISSDIGANFASGVNFKGESNDSYSDCDAYLNKGPLASRCNPNEPVSETFVPDWFSDFDGGQGILAGAAVGYSFGAQNPNGPLGGLRVELEYFYRESKYDQTGNFGCTGGSDSATCVKVAQGEFGATGPQERLGSITSHNFFANLYYDFSTAGRFTPYIGIGGGVGVTDADWASNWTRTLDQQTLRNGFPYPNDNFAGDRAQYDEYISNLAGSSSNTSTTLSDTLWGFQFLFGVDYAITEAMSLGLKGRYVMFDSFNDGIVWDPLRSHPPYIRTDQATQIAGRMSTSDIQFFGISLNLKHRF